MSGRKSTSVFALFRDSSRSVAAVRYSRQRSEEEYEYDSRGNLERIVTDGHSSTTYEYDRMNRLTLEWNGGVGEKGVLRAVYRLFLTYPARIIFIAYVSVFRQVPSAFPF